MNCEMCNSESVARVNVQTSHGEAHVECCQEHLADGYTAGLMFCPAPAITVYEGKAATLVNEFIEKLKRENPQ